MRIFATLINKNEYNREEYSLHEMIGDKWVSLNASYSKEFILRHVAEFFPVYIIRLKTKTLDNFYVEEGDLDERLY